MTKSQTAWLARLFPDNTGEARSAPRTGMQRLLILRALVTVTGLFGAIIFDFFSPLDLPVMPVTALLSGIGLSIMVGIWRVRNARPVSTRDLARQLALDFGFLIVLLSFTGGVANPLISYLLVLLAVAATLLSLLWANVFAVLAIGVYTMFLVFGILADEHSEHMMPNFRLHLVGMWVTFVVSALLITTFVSRMAAAIRSRELTLAAAREKELRNEQLIAIGTLAAGTAHALGTPLATMAVLLSDLDQASEEELHTHAIKGDIRLLREQVMRCKHSLDELTRVYKKADHQKSGLMPLNEFNDAIRDYVVNIHPGAHISFRLSENCMNLSIPADITLRHALINIIENAIKAAASEVSVHYTREDGASAYLLISVQDDGPGIPAEVMESMGEPFISTRKDSMGLGIFLANASIQRMGGEIEMFNVKNSGARTIIRLPLQTTE
jgi:two-component system, sensor histidine kinase RegB